MPKNIKQKLALILEDAESLKKYELLRLLERMFNEEMEFLQAEHQVDIYDLTNVKSQAIDMYNQMRMTMDSLGNLHGDSELIRTMCLMMATISLLRSKGLVNFTLTYKKK